MSKTRSENTFNRFKMVATALKKKCKYFDFGIYDQAYSSYFYLKYKKFVHEIEVELDDDDKLSLNCAIEIENAVKIFAGIIKQI